MKPDQPETLKPPEQPSVVSRVDQSLWFPLIAGLLGGLLGGFGAAHWSLSKVGDALAQRPLLVVQDMAAALVRIAPEDAAQAIAEQQRIARRLGDAGVVVLDADAVLAAPDGLYVRDDATAGGQGGAR